MRMKRHSAGDTRVRPSHPHLPLAAHDSMHGEQVPELECLRPGPGPHTLLRASESEKHLILAPLPGRTPPPRELEIIRTSNACKGDNHWLRLGKNGDKWLWAVHANPPLRASTRPTVAAALELWISRYGHEITPESHGQAVELLKAWKNYQGPGPEWTDRRKRGLSQPPLPREKKATPMPELLTTPQLKRKASSTGPARRRRQKGPASEDSPAETQKPMPCPRGQPVAMGPTPPETQSQTLSPSEEGYVPPEGPGPCRWQDIWTLAGKTIATERHIPRDFVGLWQNICHTLLENPAPLDQEGPDHSDLFFVLPKLIFPRGQKHAKSDSLD